MSDDLKIVIKITLRSETPLTIFWLRGELLHKNVKNLAEKKLDKSLCFGDNSDAEEVFHCGGEGLVLVE